MCRQKLSLQKDIVNNELYKSVAAKQQHVSEILLNYIIETTPVDKDRSSLQLEQIKMLTRILNGVPALKDEFNECCLVGRRNLNGTIQWFCSGVLVHPKLVLTAAHCIQNGGAYVVALGTNSQNDLAEAEILNSRKAQIHRSYTRNSKINDIAAIVLQEPSRYTPVDLATTPEIGYASEVELVGFGNDDVHGLKGFGLKRKVPVDMVSVRRNLNEDLNIAESTYGFESDLEFVAGGKGFDTCTGDSGGPVYVNTNTGKAVAGLTSRPTTNPKNPCGEGGVYTRIDVHNDFINSFEQYL